jgi:hypothetical protein
MTVQARFGPSYSRSLTVEFTAADVPGQLLIGRMPAGFFCPSCVVEIIEAFDGGVQITVGDLVAQGRFQGAADNDPETIHQYETEPHFAYPATTDVYVFFSGSPSVGRGRVILYLG